MLDALRRHGGLFGGIVAAALVGGAAGAWPVGPRGAAGPLLLLGGERGGAPVAALGGALVLLGVAIVVARLINSAVGLFIFGCGLCVMAMQVGGAADIAFSGVAATAVGMETCLWALVVGVAALAVFRFGGLLEDVQPEGAALATAWSARGLVACAAGVFAVVAAWVVLRSDLKGQAIAAALLGGLVTGLFGRLWAPGVQPLLLFPAAILALGAAQIAFASTLSFPLDVAFAKFGRPRLLFAAPIDLAGGACAGVAMGLGWAKSFAREPAAAPPRSLRA